MAVAENIQNREAHKEFTKNGTAGKRVKLEIKRQDGPRRQGSLGQVRYSVEAGNERDSQP